MSTPARYRAALDVLEEISSSDYGTELGEAIGKIALVVASFMVDTVHTEDADVAETVPAGSRPGPRPPALELPDPPGLRIDLLAKRLVELEGRVNVLELALAETSRRLPVDEQEPDVVKTIHGIPVVLAPGVDDDAIRTAIENLPAGLDSEQVVDRLEVARLLIRKTSR